jgi:hypothetical protein
MSTTFYLNHNSNTKNDETLPKLIKGKHPKKGEKRKQEARTHSCYSRYHLCDVMSQTSKS